MPETPQPFSADRLIELARAQGMALPESPALARLLETAHAASLHTAEGRPLRFELTIFSGRVKSDQSFLRLEEPLPLTVETLRRLAPATQPESSSLAVVARWEQPTEVDVVGLLETFAATRRVTDRPDVLRVVVSAPASLKLSDEHASVRFARDRYGRPATGDDVADVLPEGAVEALARRAGTPTSRGTLAAGAVELSADRAALASFADEHLAAARRHAGWVLARGILSLVDAVQRQGRGGALLFVGGQLHAHRGDLERVVEDGWLRHHELGPEERPLWNAGLLDTHAWMVHLELAELGCSVLAGVPDRGTLDDWSERIAIPRVLEAREAWREETRRLALLTGVDGAAVFDRLLRPAALGIKLRGAPLHELPPPAREAMRHRGMRHRSLAGAVQLLPGSLGVVVSQDDEVTFLANRGAGLELRGGELRLG